MFWLKPMMLVVLAIATVTRSEVNAMSDVNTVIWKKDMGAGGTLVVERAYVYGPVFNYYQYAFIHETGAGDKRHRQLLWLRRGYSASISAQIPEPQLTMLDGRVSDGVLYIVFNQYEKCWAFAITCDDASRVGIPRPAHADLDGPLNWGVGEIALGASAKTAEILPMDDLANARVTITTAENGTKRFSLVQNVGSQWRWSPTRDPEKK